MSDLLAQPGVPDREPQVEARLTELAASGYREVIRLVPSGDLLAFSGHRCLVMVPRTHFRTWLVACEKVKL